jgi:hypothetical protein
MPYPSSNGQQPAVRGRGSRFTEAEQYLEVEQSGITQSIGIPKGSIDLAGLGIGAMQHRDPSHPPSRYARDSRQGSLSLFIVSQPEQTAYQPRRLTGPAQFLVQLLDFWQLPISGACALLGYDLQEQEAVQSILSGATGLRSRDARDRVASLVKIRTLLSGLFRSVEKENEWLREPKELLGNKSPLDLMLEGSMEKLLTVRQFVEVMAGV